MTTEGNPYPGRMAFGCTGLIIADEDFVFNTYGERMPLAIDQMSAGVTGRSRGCGTPTAGHLYQSFTPSSPTLTAVDLRLRVGGDFPSEPDFVMTTVLLVRAAESVNNSLTIDGWIRAEQLAHVALKTGVSAVYASTAVHTQQTVERLADLRGLELRIYTDPENLTQQILAEHKGEVILVAGDKIAVPAIIGLLGGDSDACAIYSEYDNLCVITIPDDSEIDVMNLQYGKQTP